MDGVGLESLLNRAKQLAEDKDSHNFAKTIATAEGLASADDDRRQLYKAEIVGLRKVNNYKIALEVTEQAEELFDGSEFENDVLRNRGIILARMGRYKEAIDILRELTKSSMIEQSIKAHTNLIWVYVMQYARKDKKIYLDKAEESSNRLLELMESYEPGDRLYKVILTNLGHLYFNQNEYDKALEVYQEQKEKLTEEKDYPIVYNNLAAVLLEKNNTELAEEYLDIALRYAERYDNHKEIAENCLVRAKIAMRSEDYHQVKDYYIVAYDSLCDANDLSKACLVFKDMQKIDFKVNNESINRLSKKI